jgi:diguanylate cyclase (GGDEF)-like protein/PAS domain S-box-containing protein
MKNDLLATQQHPQSVSPADADRLLEAGDPRWQVNRELRMLSSCNQLLVRASDESELLGGICNLIVDVGGYRMAWVGMAENDAEKTVCPVAIAGAGANYLEGVRITWDSSPTGAGPTGRAIRERVPIVCASVEADPSYSPWRAEALAHGYRASVGLPLILDSGKVGALAIYSERTPAFEPEEVALLMELANDVAYGISAIRRRVAHERAERKLQLFRRLLDKTDDLILVVDAPTGRLIDANHAVARRLGYSRLELLQLKVSDFSDFERAQPWGERVQGTRRAGSLVEEASYRTKDGQSFPVEAGVSYVEQGRRGFLIMVARDIKERRHHEERITHLTRVLRMQSSINAAVLRIRDGNQLLREACRLAMEIGGYERATLWVVDADGRRAQPMFSSGDAIDFQPGEGVEIGNGTDEDSSLISRAIRTGNLAVCNDLTQTQPPVAMRARLIELGYKSLVAMPLSIAGRQGALMLAARNTNLVSDEELRLLQDIRASLAFALESGEAAGAVEYLAYFDPLTGLAKRQLLCTRLDALLRGQSEPHKQMTIAVFDIHGLTSINDSFGRRVGDLLLQRVAERLKHNVESEERVGYLGGGTFVLIEPGRSVSAENIAALLDATVFGEKFEVEGHLVRVSFLLGVTRYPNDGERADLLVQNAEATLNRAKKSGEQYLTYELKMHSAIAEGLELERKLRMALDEQQFVLHYQPQVDIASGRIVSVEALLRWSDPDEGLVPPVRFLPVLESSGLIVPVGAWAMQQAVADCRRWRSMGLGPVRVAVNVSALQLRRRSFVKDVLTLAGDLNGAGYGLDLEITESSLLQDIDATTRKLQELRAAGIQIALDDFGTGYSSLGLLSHLPVDVLKIDRSFITGLPTDKACVALTSSIINLASAFGLGTVAEGVETKAQLETLRALRCVQSQGFLYSKPVPIEQIESMLAAGLPPPG